MRTTDMSRIEELEAAVSAAEAAEAEAQDVLQSLRQKHQKQIAQPAHTLKQAQDARKAAQEALRAERLKEQGPLETLNLVEIDPWSPIAVQWNGEEDNERIDAWLRANGHGNFFVSGKKFYNENEDYSRGYLYPGTYIVLTSHTEAELYKDKQRLLLEYEISSSDVDKDAE
jgi:hypothetical protein